MSNREILDQLFHAGNINIRRGGTFETNPQKFGKPVSFARLEGMMLGLAMGDSLGNTSESLSPAERTSRFGEIRNYIGNRHVGGSSVGLPSDDTQMAFWTIEHILDEGAFNPSRLAEIFSQRRIFGMGKTVREFKLNHSSGMDWQECAPQSAGNGALMRIAPILIPHLKTGDENLWIDTSLCARVTHNDSASIASCVAFVKMLWELLDMDEAPDPRWWLDSFADTLDDLEVNKGYSPRFGRFLSFRGSVGELCREKVGNAYSQGLSVVEACNSWGSGAFLLETVPSALYILMNHGNDPEKAIVRAVNDTRDNDTIAAIVGAAVGALHGSASLPERWKSRLLGRTTHDDEGKVQELLRGVEAWLEQ